MIVYVKISARELVKLKNSQILDDKTFQENLEEIVNNIIEKKLPDFCKILEFYIQEIINAQFDVFVGAERYSRNNEKRKTYRNGSRPRTLLTSFGKLHLRIPKSRRGSFFPSILNKYERITDAMICTLQQAYIHGVSTRSMHYLYKGLEEEGLSKSTISRLSQKLLAEIKKWNNKSVEKEYLYIWLDGKYVKTKPTKKNSVCVLHGIGVTADGTIESLGYHIAPAENEDTWTYYLKKLKSKGLESASLWIRDNHKGLMAALDKEFPEARQQRCTVHWMKNVLDGIKADDKPTIKLALQMVNSSDTKKDFNKAHQILCNQLEKKKYHNIRDDVMIAKEDINNYLDFPEQHRSKIMSNNVIERMNEELNRRFKTIPIFPNIRSVEILTGSILYEISHSWNNRGNYLTRNIVRKKSGSMSYSEILALFENMPE